MLNEYELVSCPRLPDCLIFSVDLLYRPLHLHKELEFCYILSGFCRITNENEQFSASADDILLFDSDRAHEIISEKGSVRFLTIQLSRAFCRRYFPQIQNLRFCDCKVTDFFSESQRSQIRNTMLMAFSDYLTAEPSALFSCMSHINSLFSMILAAIPYQIIDSADVATQIRITERLHRILQYLNEHSRESICLSELARREHITQTYLSQFFKKHMHISMQEYLSRLRLEDAMFLLKTTDMNLSDVSFTSGFSDPKYLNQSFQRHIHTSPQSWRSSGKALDFHPQSEGHTLQRFLADTECRGLINSLLS